MCLSNTDIEEAYDSGDMGLVVRIAQQFLADDKNVDDGLAWELLGLAQHQLSDFESSVSSLEHASLLIPLSSLSRLGLAYGYGQIGKQELSRDLLLTLIKDSNVPNELLLQVATALDAVKQPVLAMKACRRAVERDPQLSQAYYDMGYYAKRSGYSPKVVESLVRRAISLDPQCVCFRIGLVALLLQHDRPQEALDHVRDLTACQIDSISCSKCLQRVAELYASVKDQQRVERCKLRILHLERMGVPPDCE